MRCRPTRSMTRAGLLFLGILSKVLPKTDEEITKVDLKKNSSSYKKTLQAYMPLRTSTRSHRPMNQNSAEGFLKLRPLFCTLYLCRPGLIDIFSARSDGELLGLEWGIIPQVSNIIFPDENSGVRCQYSRESDKIWCLAWRKRGKKFFEFFVYTTRSGG